MRIFTSLRTFKGVTDSKYNCRSFARSENISQKFKSHLFLFIFKKFLIRSFENRKRNERKQNKNELRTFY